MLIPQRKAVPMIIRMNMNLNRKKKKSIPFLSNHTSIDMEVYNAEGTVTSTKTHNVLPCLV